uniref:Uncharacterized protein n=1 Tax=viral metagenome TaxID=1070528 RepID=A0A6H1Z8L8_9ZZZZ
MRNFTPTGHLRWTGSRWFWEIIKECGVAGTVVKLFDAPYAPAFVIPCREFKEHIKQHGVYRQVGIYQFVRADDPAASCIQYAHQYPEAAGRELYDLRMRHKDMNPTK